jgi:hemoglobin
MTIYEALGEAKIRKMVSLFYEKIEHDEVIRPMYPKDLAPTEDRLHIFLIQVFGGLTTYSENEVIRDYAVVTFRMPLIWMEAIDG